MRLLRIIAAFCSLSGLLILSSCANSNGKQDEKAKYIFLFIGDGMGFGHISCTESYLSYKAGKLGGEMLTMTQFPYFGTATSYSANRNVTDSSAAGTAIAVGEKTNNYSLGVNAEGEAVNSVASELKEEGYQIGIISDGPVNHATPAAFYGHSTDRFGYYEISMQIPDSGFDFFAGSGFLAYKGKDGDQEPTDVYLESKGYEVCYGGEEFRKYGMGKEFAIFCQESSRNNSVNDYITSGKPAMDMDLKGMLQLGIEFLGTDEPFFIMCENGLIDWAAHANKTMPAVASIIDFDDAVKVAYDFYMEHPDETLIIVTSDHETGGMSLGSGGYSVKWKFLEEQWEKDGCQNNLNKEDNEELNRKASIGWTAHGHTGGHVPVFAIGKGAEKFGGRMDNTDFKDKILCE